MQKYYVENSHEGIVTKDEFAAAQAEFARRNSLRGYSKTGKSEYSSKLPFSGKLFCANSNLDERYGEPGLIGDRYGICVNHKMNGDEACPQQAIMEHDLERAFIRAMNKLVGGKEY